MYHARWTDEDYCSNPHPAWRPAEVPRYVSPMIYVVSIHIQAIRDGIHTEGSDPKTRARSLDISKKKVGR